MGLIKIDAVTARKMQASGEALILDVRDVEQYKKEHIKDAKNVPMTEANAILLLQITGKKLVLHCNRGGRATRICNKLVQDYPDLEIYHLDGGIQGWKEAELPIE